MVGYYEPVRSNRNQQCYPPVGIIPADTPNPWYLYPSWNGYIRFGQHIGIKSASCGRDMGNSSSFPQTAGDKLIFPSASCEELIRPCLKSWLCTDAHLEVSHGFRHRRAGTTFACLSSDAGASLRCQFHALGLSGEPLLVKFQDKCSGFFVRLLLFLLLLLFFLGGGQKGNHFNGKATSQCNRSMFCFRVPTCIIAAVRKYSAFDCFTFEMVFVVASPSFAMRQQNPLDSAWLTKWKHTGVKIKDFKQFLSTRAGEIPDGSREWGPGPLLDLVYTTWLLLGCPQIPVKCLTFRGLNSLRSWMAGSQVWCPFFEGDRGLVQTAIFWSQTTLEGGNSIAARPSKPPSRKSPAMRIKDSSISVGNCTQGFQTLTPHFLAARHL